jgi:hypothetical protein
MGIGEKHPTRWPKMIIGFCAVLLASPLTGAENLRWEWRNPKYARQALRKAKIVNAERTAIAKAISNQVGSYTPNMKFFAIDSEQQLREAILDTPIELVDLNGDGILEVIAQGTTKEGCSPTGNCPFWVFQKSGREYRLLISLRAIQTFQIQRSRSDRFRDIVVGMHGSAFQKTLRLLQYGRGQYHEASCYEANWSGNTPADLKEPQLTPCESR